MIEGSVMAKKETEVKKIQKCLVAAGLILLPLILGLVAAVLTSDAMMQFGKLNQPPLAPPAWLFPIVWTILYILMGVASYLIYAVKTRTKKGKKLRKTELILYFVQLLFNFFWTLLFFRWELRFMAFAWLIVMWGMILALIITAFINEKRAAWCLVPYILWCTFAAYLNIMVAVLN